MYKDHIIIPNIGIKGNLFMPSESKAIIIFVHGSGSNRFSTRNAFISKNFNEQGFAILLVDLLTEKEKEESSGRDQVFVYRPKGYNFPPSRGRRSFEIKKMASSYFTK